MLKAAEGKALNPSHEFKRNESIGPCAASIMTSVILVQFYCTTILLKLVDIWYNTIVLIGPLPPGLKKILLSLWEQS